ncbi:MAG: hypothetical protein EOP94_01540 [Zymomonas sp.]|nr:MAG: hypothetical protein EOP94_01540 [Zymomonas sp.]
MTATRALPRAISTIVEHAAAISCITALDHGRTMFISVFGSDPHAWPLPLLIALFAITYAAGLMSARLIGHYYRKWRKTRRAGTILAPRRPTPKAAISLVLGAAIGLAVVLAAKQAKAKAPPKPKLVAQNDQGAAEPCVQPHPIRTEAARAASETD